MLRVERGHEKTGKRANTKDTSPQQWEEKSSSRSHSKADPHECLDPNFHCDCVQEDSPVIIFQIILRGSFQLGGMRIWVASAPTTVKVLLLLICRMNFRRMPRIIIIVIGPCHLHQRLLASTNCDVKRANCIARFEQAGSIESNEDAK